MIEARLEGRVVVVTGANNPYGIGAATAKAFVTPELEREILPSIPLGRVGSPEEVADVIVFLASEQARWVTGQRIYVGGGHGM